MDTGSIAKDFVSLCQNGQFEEAGRKYWSDDVVSLEPMGDAREMHGKAAVAGKGQWWRDNHEVHGATVEGPYVSGDDFTVRFAMDITPKQSGQRMIMDEIATYSVRDGKITQEKFVYRAA
jgi:ketosteroid isomerase-like protein